MRRRAAWLAALALAGCGGEAEDPGRARDRALVDALRGGGLVLVFRHAATEPRTDEVESLRSCGRQRNLSARGRDQARAIGEAIRALRIRIGEVRTSPMCRTRDTARLAFGRATPDRDLVSPGVIGTIEDDDRRARALRRMAQTPPRRGANTVLVTHTGNIGGAFQASLSEGGALVFRPRRSASAPALVGRVGPEDWTRLREAAGG